MNQNDTFWHNLKALLVLEPFILLAVLKYATDVEENLVYLVFGITMVASLVSILVITKYIQKK